MYSITYYCNNNIAVLDTTAGPHMTRNDLSSAPSAHRLGGGEASKMGCSAMAASSASTSSCAAVLLVNPKRRRRRGGSLPLVARQVTAADAAMRIASGAGAPLAPAPSSGTATARNPISCAVLRAAW